MEIFFYFVIKYQHVLPSFLALMVLCSLKFTTAMPFLSCDWLTAVMETTFLSEQRSIKGFLPISKMCKLFFNLLYFVQKDKNKPPTLSTFTLMIIKEFF